MAKKKKETRISEEMENLTEICEGLTGKKLELALKICDKMAYLKVTIEDCQADMDERGIYEKFQQSDKVDPYDRARPIVQAYQGFTNSYQKYLKQLADLLPDESKEQSDGFEDFLNRRG